MKKLSKKIVVANWKMSLDYKNSLALAKRLDRGLAKKSFKNDIVIAPDFLSYQEVKKNIKNRNILFSAQDVSPLPLGSYTGEVSLEALNQSSCSYIIVGHSERRKYFFDDSLVAIKMKNILENSDITPILCVGENKSERDSGMAWPIILSQLKQSLSKVKTLRGKTLIIAYEPVWAIGTGRVVEVSDAIIIHKKIKEFVEKKFKNNLPKEFGVIYGGSVDLKNYKNFRNIDDVSGLLIGGASLRSGDFIKIASNF